MRPQTPPPNKTPGGTKNFSVSDPNSLNPDPDPGILLNPDPDPGCC